MAEIWAPETRFQIWLEIEIHACEAMAELGIIPKDAAQAVREKGAFEVTRIDEIERETRHDVIAFLTNLAEHVGPEARFVHQGMTSSDVLDTCLAVQLSRAAGILDDDLEALLAALKSRAHEHKDTLCVGRSHGIHAEPTTFGLKLAQAYAEFERNRDRLREARREIATCAISGAVGTFANVDPRVEAHVAEAMGLAVEPISTQVIPRDRHAMFFATLGVIASSIERLATEIRHLQRTEVLEAEERFATGQKGSSSMPHKRNPVLSENLTGLARVVRAAVVPALENVALWHERDISHSSVERMIAPDATLPRHHARQPGPPGRPDPLAGGAAGADAGRRQPRGRLCLRPAQRHVRVGEGRQLPRQPQGRSGRDRRAAGGRAGRPLRPRPPHPPRGYHLPPRLRRELRIGPIRFAKTRF
jgi:adenylosuccinate lyase